MHYLCKPETSTFVSDTSILHSIVCRVQLLECYGNDKNLGEAEEKLFDLFGRPFYAGKM
jgi:hypothetical protein